MALELLKKVKSSPIYNFKPTKEELEDSEKVLYGMSPAGDLEQEEPDEEEKFPFPASCDGSGDNWVEIGLN